MDTLFPTLAICALFLTSSNRPSDDLVMSDRDESGSQRALVSESLVHSCPDLVSAVILTPFSVLCTSCFFQARPPAAMVQHRPSMSQLRG